MRVLCEFFRISQSILTFFTGLQMIYLYMTQNKCFLSFFITVDKAASPWQAMIFGLRGRSISWLCSYVWLFISINELSILEFYILHSRRCICSRPGGASTGHFPWFQAGFPRCRSVRIFWISKNKCKMTISLQ